MSTINHVAVWVAGIVQFMLGAGWYTLLGRAWMAGIGKDEVQLAAEIGHSPLPYIISLVTGLVIAYTLAWLLPKVGAASAAAGAKTGALLGAGADRHDARAELRVRGAPRVAVAHQRGLHDRRHGDHGRHRRPLEEGRVTNAMADLTERLARCYTGAVHDVLRMMGHHDIVLPPEIKAIAPGTRLAGPVWTVSGHIDRSKSRHETLLGWCTLLAKAPSGHVVVCQPNNHEVALMGELSAQTLAARGVRAMSSTAARATPISCSSRASRCSARSSRPPTSSSAGFRIATASPSRSAR